MGDKIKNFFVNFGIGYIENLHKKPLFIFHAVL